jgi:hypothetical protein
VTVPNPGVGVAVGGMETVGAGSVGFGGGRVGVDKSGGGAVQLSDPKLPAIKKISSPIMNLKKLGKFIFKKAVPLSNKQFFNRENISIISQLICY